MCRLWKPSPRVSFFALWCPRPESAPEIDHERPHFFRPGRGRPSARGGLASRGLWRAIRRHPAPAARAGDSPWRDRSGRPAGRPAGGGTRRRALPETPGALPAGTRDRGSLGRRQDRAQSRCGGDSGSERTLRPRGAAAADGRDHAAAPAGPRSAAAGRDGRANGDPDRRWHRHRSDDDRGTPHGSCRRRPGGLGSSAGGLARPADGDPAAL